MRPPLWLNVTVGSDGWSAELHSTPRCDDEDPIAWRRRTSAAVAISIALSWASIVGVRVNGHCPAGDNSFRGWWERFGRARLPCEAELLSQITWAHSRLSLFQQVQPDEPGKPNFPVPSDKDIPF